MQKTILCLLLLLGAGNAWAVEPAWRMRAREGFGWGDLSLEIKNERQALILVTHNPAVAARMSRTLTFSAGSLR